ncbi:uncharacterized protein V6R79_025369 [Siganus canaliculatus]
MSTDDVLEREDVNIWLNDTSIQSISRAGKVVSLTISSAVESKLTLEYGGSVQYWAIQFNQSTRFTVVRGQKKPLEQLTTISEGFLDLINSLEVFPCENGTLFFHQDENFVLALGHTEHLPVKFQSRSPSMLLMSWVENHPAVSESHTTALFHAQLGSYDILSTDATIQNHYSFTGLESCSSYVACVEIAETHSFICLPAKTEPNTPTDFEVTSWNSSSISVAWDCPENSKYSLFLLTIFYLNGTDHVTDAVPLWYEGDDFAFTLSDLPPCSRVSFGLQTVCQEGTELLYSKTVLNEGNSVHSDIKALCQISFGPDNYTLSWEVRNTSSISMFRVYHDGALQGSTLATNYTVQGLLPCQQYQATVEALCGDGVLVNVKRVAAHTGPQGVSDLQYRSNDSTAVWVPSTTAPSAVAFLYELSSEDGTTLQSSRVNDTELHLPGLEEGKSYILDVWEECDGQWESDHSHVCFEGSVSTMEALIRSIRPASDQELDLDFSSMGLLMVVPWSLPEGLDDDLLEPRGAIVKIFEDKLQNLLKDFDKPVRLELASIAHADKLNETEIHFTPFEASSAEDVLLAAEDLLDYIHDLNAPHVTVKHGVIRWDGPDLCAASKLTLCPHNSLCVNTLGSYTCLCRHGYYDVSSFLEASSHPVCNGNGLFSQCQTKLVTGGIAKSYLTSHMGGRVDVQLNDGRCAVEQTEIFYYFRASRKASECGTKRRFNRTHIEFHNTLSVSLSKEHVISRRDLKIVWKCIYPRHYFHNTQVSVDTEWFSTHSLVEFNSSVQLGLTLALYPDDSYTSSYRDIISLVPEDTLFFQVALQTNNTFASDVLLQLESCWATESTDPHDEAQGVLLQDGCPVDTTFHWLSVNGMAQKSRFSLQMFTMPKGLPLYVHCQANICGPDEDCVKICNNQQRIKRSKTHMYRKGKRAALVSAGPLVITKTVKSGVPPSNWAEHMVMVCIIAGSIGFLGLTILLVSASKAIMTYYEQLRLQC